MTNSSISKITNERTWLDFDTRNNLVDQANSIYDEAVETGKYETIGDLLNDIESATEHEVLPLLFILKDTLRRPNLRFSDSMLEYLGLIIHKSLDKYLKNKDIVYECLNVLINITGTY